jgi:hypothetical protein
MKSSYRGILILLATFVVGVTCMGQVAKLIAQSWEKTGDAMRAKEYYGKVMANNGHGPTNAFARPVARKKLAGG